MEKLNLLLLEDDQNDVHLIKRVLHQSDINFEATVTSSEDEFTSLLTDNTYDVILADNSLPQFNASYALKVIRSMKLDTPCIIVTGTMIDESASEILREGACDYILKDKLNRLPTSILNAIRNHKLQTEYQKKLDDIVKKEAIMKEAERLAHFGSWELDVASNTYTWSDENYRILGCEVGEIFPSRENFYKCIHPEDLDYVKNVVDDAVRHLDHKKYNFRVISRKDGRVKFIESQIFITRDENRKVIRLNGQTRDASEEKRAEQQKNNTEKKYRTLFENNPVPMWVIDPVSLQFYDVNNAAIRHYGYSFEEFLSITALEIRPEDEHERYLALDKTENNSGNLGLWKHKKKDGTIIFVEIIVDHITYEGKKSLLVISHDITERTEAEIKLQHTASRLQQAQEIAHVGSFDLDFSSGFGIWSDEACKIYGLTPEENKQTFESWVQFVHPEDIDGVMKVIEESNKNTSGAEFNHRIIRKDGSIRHLQVRFELEKNNDGTPVGIYGISHDVTEKKEAEQALIQSEANLRKIMDLLPQSISVRDRDGNFLFVNKSLASLYGRTPEEMTGTPIRIVLPAANEFEEFLARDRAIINSGKVTTMPEILFTSLAGGTKIFNVTKVPFIPAGRNEPAILGIGTDITEQKRAETDRMKMTEDILQRNKDLEQFSYIISHNLRAPVANILGISDLVTRENLTEDEKIFLMTGLAESVKKLDYVISDLNQITQIKHTISEHKTPVKLSALVDNITGLLPADTSVSIKTDFSEVDGFVTVSNYMHSIFYNLITNSIKYRQAGMPLCCEITSKKVDDNIHLLFKDNGMGIDLEKTGDQIFELYKRFHIGAAEGKGMGLFMVKSHVESLGGKISVKSEVNRGTEFKIVLPILAAK